MKIISWNVNGIRSVYKKGFLDFLSSTNPDVICLQEIKSQEMPQLADLFTKDPTNDYFVSTNFAQKRGYSGVAVFSKEKPLKVVKTLGHKRFDVEGRYVELAFKDFTIINVYIPHGARDKRNLVYKLEVYELLAKSVQSKAGQHVVICGDFNVARSDIDLANPQENKNNIMFTPDERSGLEKIISYGFVDTFRKFQKSGGYYSWWPYRKSLRGRNIGWRIDYILTSYSLDKVLKDGFILSSVYGSDHCPVGIEMAI